MKKLMEKIKDEFKNIFISKTKSKKINNLRKEKIIDTKIKIQKKQKNKNNFSEIGKESIAKKQKNKEINQSQQDYIKELQSALNTNAPLTKENINKISELIKKIISPANGLSSSDLERIVEKNKINDETRYIQSMDEKTNLKNIQKNEFLQKKYNEKNNEIFKSKKDIVIPISDLMIPGLLLGILSVAAHEIFEEIDFLVNFGHEDQEKIDNLKKMIEKYEKNSVFSNTVDDSNSKIITIGDVINNIYISNPDLFDNSNNILENYKKIEEIIKKEYSQKKVKPPTVEEIKNSLGICIIRAKMQKIMLQKMQSEEKKLIDKNEKSVNEFPPIKKISDSKEAKTIYNLEKLTKNNIFCSKKAMKPLIKVKNHKALQMLINDDKNLPTQGR